MSIVLTGAAGFIGSNLLYALNARGETDIIAVDNLTRGDKFKNLADCRFAEYFDKTALLCVLKQASWRRNVRAILHQGACSDTMESDGRYMMENNYRYSVELFQFCRDHAIPFIYASSAAVYGAGTVFEEEERSEQPLNVYGYSKALFDQYVRRHWRTKTAQVVGLRYFNVYGPRESHKARMASVAYHFLNQYLAGGHVRLFEGSGGYGAGEQLRDFVHVDDVVNINLFFLAHPAVSGIFNAGTGRAQSFNEVAVATVNAARRARGSTELTLDELRARDEIQYVSFPEGLKEKYQSYTQANLTRLKQAGYGEAMSDVGEGVSRYVSWMLGKEHR
ncbi:MAG: ADP-glyceromanno-heptose 6-epimerase [Betaproteobacteria bacterium]|nr:ADP-glyceromanno-heptose 6-epimerase [Betaproteobacteria bacterium]